MDIHGQSLLLEESSAEISSLVKLQRLAERIAEVHSSNEPKGDPQMEALNAEVNIQIFQHEIQEWRNSTSAPIRNLRTLILNSLCGIESFFCVSSISMFVLASQRMTLMTSFCYSE
jgi:hypothetical protein